MLANNTRNPHGSLEAGEPQEQSEGASNGGNNRVEVVEEHLLRHKCVCVLIVNSDVAPIDQCLELHVDALIIRELHVDAWTLASSDLCIEHQLCHIVL